MKHYIINKNCLKVYHQNTLQVSKFLKFLKKLFLLDASKVFCKNHSKFREKKNTNELNNIG